MMILTLILALAAGCTLVGDTVTGVSLNKANPTSCLHGCAGSSADQVRAEVAAHKAAIEGCGALPESDHEACMTAEAARHQAAMATINAGRQECMNSCHRQGSGSAG
jgi:hypothetical protein